MMEVGEKIGRFEIKAPLGKGGMGAVYIAIDAETQQEVALKVLLAGGDNYQETLSRFCAEARALEKLRDIDGVVNVRYFEAPDKSAAYLVMDLLRGKTLRQRLREQGNRLAVREALELARTIATTMVHVHAKDVIHRDLKPENIMLVPNVDRVPSTVPWIIDFGVVKIQRNSSVDDQALTNVLTFLNPGSPEYMAPECALDASKCSSKADVYALGIILYEMLAGKRPFVADELLELMKAHRENPPPRLDKLESMIAPELADIVEKMLDKEAGGRPSMQECAALFTLDWTKDAVIARVSTAQRLKNRVHRMWRAASPHIATVKRTLVFVTPRRLITLAWLVLTVVGGWWWFVGADAAFDERAWEMRGSLGSTVKLQSMLLDRLDELNRYQWLVPGIRRSGMIMVLHQLSDFERIHGTLVAAEKYEDEARTFIDDAYARGGDKNKLLPLRAMSASKRGKIRLAENDAVCARHDVEASIGDLNKIPQKTQNETMMLATSRLELGQAELLGGDLEAADRSFSEAMALREQVAGSTGEAYWRLMFAEAFLFRAKSTKDSTKAVNDLEQSLANVKEGDAGDETWRHQAILARIQCEYGNVHRRKREWSEAKQSYSAGRTIAEKLVVAARTHKDNALILIEVQIGLENVAHELQEPALEQTSLRDRCEIANKFVEKDPRDKRFVFKDCKP